jgi:hypothetical protein
MLHRIFPLETILRQFNTVPNFTHYLLKIHFNIISPSTPKDFKASTFLWFSVKHVKAFLHVAVISSSLICLQYYYVNFKNHTAPHYAMFSTLLSHCLASWVHVFFSEICLLTLTFYTPIPIWTETPNDIHEKQYLMSLIIFQSVSLYSWDVKIFVQRKFNFRCRRSSVCDYSVLLGYEDYLQVIECLFSRIRELACMKELRRYTEGGLDDGYPCQTGFDRGAGKRQRDPEPPDWRLYVNLTFSPRKNLTVSESW